MLSKEKLEEYASKIEPLYTRDDYGQKKPVVVRTVKRNGYNWEIKMAVLE